MYLGNGLDLYRSAVARNVHHEHLYVTRTNSLRNLSSDGSASEKAAKTAVTRGSQRRQSSFVGRCGFTTILALVESELAEA